MAFTPSNLYLTNAGSSTLYIAQVNGSVTSGTNQWVSGIPDIIDVIGNYTQASTAATDSSFAVAFTATSGTISTTIPLSESGTPFSLWVIAGGAEDTLF